MNEQKIIPELLASLSTGGLPKAVELAVFLRKGPSYRGCDLKRGITHRSGRNGSARLVSALKAMRNLEDEKPQRAMALLKRAIVKNKDSFWLRYIGGCILYYNDASANETRLRQAWAAIDSALKVQTKACGYSLRAAISLELGEAERSIADARSALALDAGDEVASLCLMESLLNIGRKSEALEEARRSSKILPRNGFALARAGRIQGILGDYAAASRNLNRAIALNSKCVVFRTWRSEVRRRTGKAAAALKDLDEALKINPTYHLAYTWRGRLHLNRKCYKAAVSDFNRALKLNPNQLRARAWRAGAYWKMGNCSQAAIEFDAIYPREPQSTWNRGAIADAARRASHGIVNWGAEGDPFWLDMEEVVSGQPLNAWAHAFRGRCFIGAGKWAQAATDLDRALQLDPDLAYAYRWRGELFRRMGQPRKALSDLQRALKLEPEHPLAKKLKGELKMLLRRN